ncbi:Lipocalin-like domain-containing protein [Hymenobacter daecheongensis DSM 21074]|uniref:Lipocalin-like domain-containing protein n=1 Tax=Hymenobacter daecheongensis DSM 21074 TaxID=1121955 RepID=A0A1M6AFV1_9BACT|nr:lipocalin family protein [Hymenobacter daecheongensis]SHI35292.1 Lipocalin-like domain-containing protein [Hymenobacter daecheongensis DSM 21074]
MKNSSLLLGALLLAVPFTACKKDDDKAPSKADTLTAKSWQLTASTITIVEPGSPTTTEDAYKALDDCEKDNFMKFNSNKVLELNEGKTKCQTSDPQVQSGSWDINADQTKLYLNNASMGGSLAAQMDIVELSDSKLVLKSVVVEDGATATYNLTFKAL